MNRRIPLLTVALFAMVGVGGAQAQAFDPTFSAYSAFVDVTARTATFSITFTITPDLLTVDPYGRQADSFQFWVDPDEAGAEARANRHLTGLLPYSTQTLVSAVNVPVSGNLDLIWVTPDADPSAPGAGGWGAYKSSVPFQLNGNVLSFTARLEALQVPGDTFYYTLAVYHYGGGLEDFDAISGRGYSHDYPVPNVPEPGSGWLITLGLIAIFGCRRTRRIGSDSLP